MIHHIFANRSNAGDWLSAQGIQRLLGPLPVVEHLCDEPFREKTLRSIAGAAPGDLILVGGGGLFMDYFAPFWKKLLEVLGARPLCIWGVGVCDHVDADSLGDARMYREAARRARLCVVRDERTRTLLEGDSLPEPVPCPSLNAIEGGGVPGHGLLHSAHFDLVGEDFYRTMVDRGRSFAARTNRVYRETNNRFRNGRKEDLDACLQLYASSDLVLSSRLHGCILGLASGCRVLAVGGDWKITAFMECAGLADWVIPKSAEAGLVEGLERLPEQPPVAGFLDRARLANEEVARRVKRLAGHIEQPS